MSDNEKLLSMKLQETLLRHHDWINYFSEKSRTQKTGRFWEHCALFLRISHKKLLDDLEKMHIKKID